MSSNIPGFSIKPADIARLQELPIGSLYTINGILFKIVIPRKNSLSPCLQCALDAVTRVPNDKSIQCPLLNSCAAHLRKDKISVVFKKINSK